MSEFYLDIFWINFITCHLEYLSSFTSIALAIYDEHAYQDSSIKFQTTKSKVSHPTVSTKPLSFSLVAKTIAFGLGAVSNHLASTITPISLQLDL